MELLGCTWLEVMVAGSNSGEQALKHISSIFLIVHRHVMDTCQGVDRIRYLLICVTFSVCHHQITVLKATTKTHSRYGHTHTHTHTHTSDFYVLLYDHCRVWSGTATIYRFTGCYYRPPMGWCFTTPPLSSPGCTPWHSCWTHG